MRYLVLSVFFLVGCLGATTEEQPSGASANAYYSGDSQATPTLGGYLSIKDLDGSRLSCSVFVEPLGTDFPLPVRLWTAHHCVDKHFSIAAAASGDYPTLAVSLSGKYYPVENMQIEQIVMDRAIMLRILGSGQDDSALKLWTKTSYSVYRQEMELNILGKDSFTSCSAGESGDNKICSALEDTVTMLASIPKPSDAQLTAGLVKFAQEYLVARDLEYTALPGLEEFTDKLVTLEKYRAIFRVVALQSRIKACKAGENLSIASDDCAAAIRLDDNQTELLPARLRFDGADMSRIEAANMYHAEFIAAVNAYKSIRQKIKFQLMSNIQFSKMSENFSPEGYFAIPIDNMFPDSRSDYDSGFSVPNAAVTTMKPGDSGSIWAHNGVVPIVSTSSVGGKDIYIRDRLDTANYGPPSTGGYGFKTKDKAESTPSSPRTQPPPQRRLR